MTKKKSIVMDDFTHPASYYAGLTARSDRDIEIALVTSSTGRPASFISGVRDAGVKVIVENSVENARKTFNRKLRDDNNE